LQILCREKRQETGDGRRVKPTTNGGIRIADVEKQDRRREAVIRPMEDSNRRRRENFEDFEMWSDIIKPQNKNSDVACVM